MASGYWFGRLEYLFLVSWRVWLGPDVREILPLCRYIGVSRTAGRYFLDVGDISSEVVDTIVKFLGIFPRIPHGKCSAISREVSGETICLLLGKNQEKVHTHVITVGRWLS